MRLYWSVWILIVSIILCVVVYLGRYLVSLHPAVSLPDGYTHDFGVVEKGGALKHDFRICNIGRKDLLIENIVSSCGCTSTEVGAKKLSSNEETTLSVTFRTRPSDKPEAVTIMLSTDDPQNEVVKFHLTAHVKRKVFWYPSSVCLANDAEGGEIQLKTNDANTIEVAEIRKSSEDFDVSYTAIDRGVLFRFKLNENCEKGIWTEHADIHLKIHSSDKNVMIPIFGFVE